MPQHVSRSLVVAGDVVCLCYDHHKGAVSTVDEYDGGVSIQMKDMKRAGDDEVCACSLDTGTRSIPWRLILILTL